MSNKFDPFAFIKIAREEPEKIPIEERLSSFHEIYHCWQNSHKIQAQASRCLSCGNPYCSWACPLNNFIPDWLQQIQSGHWQQAAELMYRMNPLPEICGRVCPQDRLCEGACTLNTGFGAVTIGFLEKTITDHILAQGWQPTKPKLKQLSARVAIIGSGPAGLGCADYLARQGIQCVVFERSHAIGGLLRFGIPSFKLAKSHLIKRQAWLSQLGVEFYLNTSIGRDISMAELLTTFDAVFVATGCYQAVQGHFVGEDLVGVMPALSFLKQYACDDELLDKKTLVNQRVVVLGGGDTAMDCTRTARRLGASEVYCIYRRDEQAMPGSRREVANAKQEGVNFIFQQQPIGIIRDEQSKLALCLQLQATDDFKKITEVQADKIIIAFGFVAETLDWLTPLAVQCDVKGRICVKSAANDDYAYQTDHPQIFAGGDIVRGADLVVTAIADGRGAAQSILKYLQKKQ